MVNLDDLKNVDPRTVDRSSLVERSSVKIDPNATKEERLSEYIKQIKNPYCYLDGKTVVKISFANTDTSIEDCISNYLKGV
ncbi:DUF6870 family protein [Tannockella kyphosi]|uniref:DUF6870 family protein n=1 Tax=Tannockella kyphosi TaxID=2899121 RepID=UPI0020132158|nr:hypothetical protein [Tannockella kyphosi]